MIAGIGGGLAGIAALLVYLAAPNQQLLASPLRARRLLRLAAMLCLGLSLGLLRQWAGPATAVFIVLTAVMLVWAVVPLAAAWRRAAGPKP